MSIISDVLARRFEEVAPMDFYREIFPDGELDTWAEGDIPKTSGKYAAIAVEVTNEKKKDGRPLVKRYSITDELDGIDFTWGNADAIVEMAKKICAYEGIGIPMNLASKACSGSKFLVSTSIFYLE